MLGQRARSTANCRPQTVGPGLTRDSPGGGKVLAVITYPGRTAHPECDVTQVSSPPLLSIYFRHEVDERSKLGRHLAVPKPHKMAWSRLDRVIRKKQPQASGFNVLCKHFTTH